MEEGTGERPGGPAEEILGKVPESLPSSGDSSGHASSESAEVKDTGAEVKLLAEPGPG